MQTQNQPVNQVTAKSDNIASTLFLEDHLKGILSKTSNTHFKPWKMKEAPRNPHSPFGDFPKEFLHVNKIDLNKHTPVYEDSQAVNNNSEKL